ncbi:MAG: hypothetical protein AAF841_05540 [Pseudomonadota bacterium]
MTFTDYSGGWATNAEAESRDTQTGTNPPRKRVTPPLLMGDILQSRRGIPVFVEDWLRLEKERDARRAERARLDHFTAQKPR